jgi:hypothetical protein
MFSIDGARRVDSSSKFTLSRSGAKLGTENPATDTEHENHYIGSTEQQGRGLRTRSIVQAQAAQLREAWIAGDRCRLDRILAHFRETDLIGEGQDEREELLRCVALKMKRAAELPEPVTKPHHEAWLRMLTHLAD